MVSKCFKTILILAFLGINSLFLQAQHATGLGDDDVGYDTTSTVLLPSSKADLPRSVNLKPYCPMPGNQGLISSCVGWSVGYGLLTIEKAIQNGEMDTRRITENAYSALFVYNQIRGSESNCNSLSNISEALDLLKTKGNCLAREFDIKVEDCYNKPDNILKRSALNNIIADYSRLFDKDTEGDVRVFRIRSLLAQNKPVAIGLKINAQFMSLKETDYWNPALGKEPVEGHAMVVVGYDDDAACFILLNSWGKVWGREGFIKVKYRDMADYCRYAFVIHLTKNGRPVESLVVTETGFEKSSTRTSLARINTNQSTPSVKQPAQTVNSQSPTPPTGNQKSKQPVVNQPNAEDNIGVSTPHELVEMSGSFEVNYYTGRWTDNAEPILETLSVEQVDNHYMVSKKDWRVGDGFQLALTSKIGGAYVYIISVNPRNEVKIMFPRNEDFGRQYKGMYESSLMMLDGARVVLPGPKKVIKVDYAGTDRICILFSTRKIFGFPKFCQKVQNWSGNFDAYLHKLLGDIMIPATDTNFSPNQVSFSTATRTEGSIVPIIIEFKSQ
jgi:hypothetical protein